MKKEKYLIYGTSFYANFDQDGNKPEITMLDSREEVVEHLAKRVLSDIKDAYDEDHLDEFMTSDDEDALWNHISGEDDEDEGLIFSYGDDILKYCDGEDSYDLGIAKQEFTVDDSGNVTVTLNETPGITIREIVDAAQKLYLAEHGYADDDDDGNEE